MKEQVTKTNEAEKSTKVVPNFPVPPITVISALQILFLLLTQLVISNYAGLYPQGNWFDRITGNLNYLRITVKILATNI